MRKCEVGGQAVIEGVMMRGSKGQATAIRKPNGKIEIDMKKVVPITKRYKFLNIPFSVETPKFITNIRISLL